MSENNLLDNLERRSKPPKNEALKKAERFPVKGGDFMPMRRHTWFDKSTFNQKTRKTKACEL